MLRWLAPAGALLVPPLCWACGDLARRGEPLCAACRRLLPRLASHPVLLHGLPVWAPVGYSGPARELVRALKFRGAAAVAEAMAAQIAANVPAGLLGSAAGALVPVPLHPRRLRRRGFNQAAVLASALARRTGLPVADCLERSGPAITQVGRDRSARQAGPAGSFRARDGPPAGAVLVDDVATTGATLAACAAALRAAGCAPSAGIAFARTIGR